MSWGYSYPVRSDFDSQEEYEYACELYEEAEDAYAEALLESRFESRLG